MSDPPDTNDPPFVGRQKSGKAGGEATKSKHGSDFFRMIGRKGGQAKGSDAKKGRSETGQDPLPEPTDADPEEES